jgi:hypothetical protein
MLSCFQQMLYNYGIYKNTSKTCNDCCAKKSGCTKIKWLYLTNSIPTSFMKLYCKTHIWTFHIYCRQETCCPLPLLESQQQLYINMKPSHSKCINTEHSNVTNPWTKYTPVHTTCIQHSTVSKAQMCELFITENKFIGQAWFAFNGQG